MLPTLDNCLATLQAESDCLRLAFDHGAISESRLDARLVNGASFGERLEWLEQAGLRFAYIADDGSLLPMTGDAAFTLKRSPEMVGVVTERQYRDLASAHRTFCDTIRARQVREVLS